MPEDPDDNEGGFTKSLETGLSWLGNIGSAGDGIGGVGTAVRGAEAYQHIAPFGGTLFDAFTNGSEGVSSGESVLGGAGKALGPIGIGLSAASTLGHGALLANDISKEGFANAYHDPKAYDEAGATALGAAHTVLPFLGPYGEAANLGLTGAEVAANVGGKAAGAAFGKGAAFSADSAAGGLIRGTFGDQSAGEQVRQGIGGVFGHGTAANIAGGAADIATNAALFPQQLAMTAGKGIVNEGLAIGRGIADGQGVVGGALHSAGSAIASGASTAGGAIASGASTAGHALASGASTVGHGLASGASSVGHAVSSVFSW
jgi:hypothetical protein